MADAGGDKTCEFCSADVGMQWEKTVQELATGIPGVCLQCFREGGGECFYTVECPVHGGEPDWKC